MTESCITNLLAVTEPIRPCIDRYAVAEGTPRPATHGLLCERCWDQLDLAMRMQNSLIDFLRRVGHYRVGEQDGHGQPGPSIPPPATWLAADEIVRLAETLWAHEGEAEQIVQSDEGAADAVRLTRAILRADRKWPRRERSHRVRIIRCRACGAPTLRWWPPEAFEDDITVQCDQCGEVESYEMLSFDARLLEEEQKLRRKAA